MNWLREIMRRIAFAVRRQGFDRDLSDEMQFHLDMKAEKNRQFGLNELDARARAQRQFGNRTLLEEESRQAWGWTGIEQFLQDTKQSLRSVRNAKSFASATVLAFALAIGANVAIFSIVHAVLLRPLPYKDSDRLMIVPTSIPDFEDLRELSRTFEDSAIWATNQYAARFGAEAEQMLGAIVSSRFLPMLSAAELGRTFSDKEVHQPLAVISHKLWMTRYGGNANVLGRTLVLNDRTFTIIGVMPREFEFPNARFEVWVPLEHEMSATPEQRRNRAFRIFRAIVRMRRGVSKSAIDTEAKTLSLRLAKEYPTTNSDFRFRFVMLSEWLIGDVSTGLTFLMTTAALVLFIACVNVSNLTLARAGARWREFALRSSLGAGRLRLVRQTLTESFVTALFGGAAGVVLASFLLKVVPRLPMAEMPRISTVSINVPTLLFTLALCAFAAVLSGLVPALRVSRTDSSAALNDASRGSSGHAGIRIQRFLIAAEIVLTCVVLVAAGLLAKSLSRLVHVDTGFVPDNLLAMNIGLVSYKDPQHRVAAISRVLEELSGLPGVQYAGGSTALPPVTPQRATRFEAAAVSLRPGSDSAYFVAASPNYFKALGTPFVEGHEFTSRDTGSSPKVVILSDHLARRLFPKRSAVGEQIRLINPEYSQEWRTVIGVVHTVRYAGLAEADQPAIYVPFSQVPMLWMYVLVRHEPSAGPALLSAIRTRIHAADPSLVPMGLQPMQAIMWGTVAQPEFRTALMSGFALIALVLASVGVYSVIAYGVTQRIRELGIRLALGATRANVISHVLADSVRLCLASLVVAVPLSILLAHTMRSLLFSVSSVDPVVILSAVVVLSVVALSAAYVPAWRASRSDPLTALRYE